MPRYTDPVAQLLTFEEGRDWPLTPEEWPDYVSAVGLMDEHVDDLLRMTTDDRLYQYDDVSEGELWGPVHAWRSLAQLGATKAARPLLRLYDLISDDDRISEELRYVFAVLGPATLPTIAAMMRKNSHRDFPTIYYCDCLDEIAKRHPETRPDVIDLTVTQLKRYEYNGPGLNASLIYTLAQLKATETLPVIEQAFAAETVDEMVMGDWEDVQIEFGVLEERITPEKKRGLFGRWTEEEDELPELTDEEIAALLVRESREPVNRKTQNKRKAKRKQAKASRKKNRKRKK